MEAGRPPSPGYGRTLACLAIALLPLAGCGGPEADVEPARPSIVSLMPQVTELILELGGERHLVGRTTGTPDPRLAGITSAGDPTRPSIETIIRLDPDIVVGWRRAARAPLGAVTRAGIRTWLTESETLADLWDNLDWVGRTLGRSAAADSLARRLRAGLEHVRAGARGRPRPRVLVVVWDDPPTVAAPGTFLDELLAVAGGRNVFGRERGPWPRVSFETLIRRDPDAVFRLRQPGSDAALGDHPQWRLVPAVAAGRVLGLDSERFGRAGVRVVEAAAELAAWLHPDIGHHPAPHPEE